MNEVDLLVLSPWGVYVIEIKSRPGTISGDQTTWKWRGPDGRVTSRDNPVILTNRKAKKLATLLGRQEAFKQERTPFIEHLVFCSHPTNRILLQGPAAYFACVRDGMEVNGQPGILGAVLRRECPGMKPFQHPSVSRVQIRAFGRAMEKIGIRPMESTRRAGDYRLQRLFYDSPTGTYQEWIAKHVSVNSDPRLARIYLEARSISQAQRDGLRRAAEREFRILERLDHPSILRADTITTCELGSTLIFRFDESSIRLDHYVAERGDSLSLDEKLGILRRLAEVIQHAHEQHVIHRSLSPQSILIIPRPGAVPDLRVFNWQVGLAATDTPGRTTSRLSRSLHVDQLVEDASTVYLAPEALTGQCLIGEELDVFSLGTIAYFLFTGQPPAASPTELNEKLLRGRGHLDPSDALNAVPSALSDLIAQSAESNRSARCSVREFIELLDALEDELTAPPPEEVVDARDARAGENLTGGLTVVRRLGSGSVSVVLLVKRPDGREVVLKVAAQSADIPRLKAELATIQKLRHTNIVEAFQWVDLEPVGGFTMELAGEMTLGERLLRDGALQLDLLQRFGDELLQTVEYLEREGISHRDIKPANIGIGSTAKGPLRLTLFDFSLSSASPEEIRTGTPAYIDPFLTNRKVRRGDSHAERFAAAMTLHEMATDPERAAARQVLLAGATPDTQLLLLGLSARLLNAVDSHGLITVADLLRYPLIRIHRMRGVGNKTRRELVDLVHELRARFPTFSAAADLAEEAASLSAAPSSQPDEALLLTVDPLAQQVLLVAPGKSNGKDRQILEPFLAWGTTTMEAACRWPSQTELGGECGVTRARVQQVVSKARSVWASHPGVQSLTSVIRTLLNSQGGVMTHREVIRGVLALRGSESQEPAASVFASVVTRAAVEAAGIGEAPPFSEFRRDGKILIAVTSSLADYARRLGRAADELVSTDTLAAPANIIRRLEDIPWPTDLPTEVRPPDPARLVTLASAVSTRAAVSPRLELYPRGLEAGRALSLAVGTLITGDFLGPDDVRQRIATRYPDATPLPGRPELDECLAKLQPPLVWDPAARNGDGGYAPQRIEGLSIGTSSVSAGSTVARNKSSDIRLTLISEDQADAARLDDKLRHGAKHGSFLVLTTTYDRLPKAEKRLLSRFHLQPIDGNRLFLDAMRQVASTKKVDWQIVLTADAADHSTAGWKRLQQLVDLAVPTIRATLTSSAHTVLLTSPGLFARYGRMGLLAEAAAEVGRPGGPAGLWILLPGTDAKPTIAGAPIPLTNPAHHEVVTPAWLGLS